MLKKFVVCSFLLLPLAAQAQDAPKSGSTGNLNWAEKASWSIPAKPVDIAQSLDNKKVFILGDDNKVYILTPDGRQLGAMPVAPGTNLMDISARGEMLFVGNSSSKTFSAYDISFNQQIDITGAPVRGKVDAPVTMVIFSDFECPWCRKVEPTLAELQAKFPDKLRIVFKQLPLPMHEHAEPAALASLAAQRQGKFWEMHDALFQITDWKPTSIDDTAQALGLNMEKFRADMKSQEVQMQLAKDAADAQAADIQSTPSLFINTKPVRDRSLSAMQKMVEEALASAGAK